MAENSKIEWTDHSYNPWVGCTKISPACDHCYAEGWAKRAGRDVWGPHAQRQRTKTQGDPVKWNRDLEGTGRRERVFVASLADVFDNHKSILPEWRRDLWSLIKATPNLDWQLLTKRPQNFKDFLPDDWGDGYPNVWLGVTVENQTEAARRIPLLLATPVAKRFLSCEPLLGPLHLSCIDDLSGEGEMNVLAATDWLDEVANWRDTELDWEESFEDWYGRDPNYVSGPMHPTIDWVIAGGESGPGARPSHPEWFRSMRDQCAAAGVPFFFKQWGEWVPHHHVDLKEGMDWSAKDKDKRLHVSKAGKTGGDPHIPGDYTMYRLGKKKSGNLLDGKEHRAFPDGEMASQCFACLSEVPEGAKYSSDEAGLLCEACTPTYQNMLDGPEGFVVFETGEPMTKEQAQTAVEDHLAGGGALTDKVGLV